MGYTTVFEGTLKPNRKLTQEETSIINKIQNVRHEDGYERGISIWCNWHINKDGELEWNGAEKFYNYVEWLEYLIKNYFSLWGIVLNGNIKFRGERFADVGTIKVIDNIVYV